MTTTNVFVFSARDEQRIAFSTLEDGSNLPRADENDPWSPQFQTRPKKAALTLFGVDAVLALRAIRQDGFYITVQSDREWSRRR